MRHLGESLSLRKGPLSVRHQAWPRAGVAPQATTDLHTALTGGYVGETRVVPTLVADAVHLALTGRRLPSATVYFYGGLTDELADRFGYRDFSS